MPQLSVHKLQPKSPHAATKTQCSQINKQVDLFSRVLSFRYRLWQTVAFAGFYPRSGTDADSIAVFPGDRNARAINLLQSIKSFSEQGLPR